MPGNPDIPNLPTPPMPPQETMPFTSTQGLIALQYDLWLNGVQLQGPDGEKATVTRGNLNVLVGDQISTPVDTYFAQSISNFTLVSDTGVSGINVPSLVYTFTAAGGHGIISGDEVLLLDVASDRSFLCVVTNVTGDVLTVDRPIDHNFAAATTLGRIVTTNMAVDGSSTPQIFSARAGTRALDFTRLLIKMLSTGTMDDGKFGDLTALTNGLVFRLVNGTQKTIFNFKTNGEIANFCYDLSYAARAPAGQTGLRARITFGGQSKHGVVLRIQDDDVLQWVIQDDLTGLDTLQVVGQGHETED